MKSPFQIGLLLSRHSGALDMAAASSSFALLSQAALTVVASLVVSGNAIADPVAPGIAPVVQKSETAQTWFQDYFLLIVVFGLAVLLYASMIIYRWVKGSPLAEEETVHPPLLPVLNAETMAHATLDAKIAALRNSLYKFGAPRCENGSLFFGNYRVNGDHEVVDQIKTRFDCYATIFMKDMRVATNVLLEDGTRALNTPLAPGPAYDAVLLHGKTYSGEATLFGQPILGLYEPIFNGTEVIGMLFIGA